MWCLFVFRGSGYFVYLLCCRSVECLRELSMPNLRSRYVQQHYRCIKRGRVYIVFGRGLLLGWEYGQGSVWCRLFQRCRIEYVYRV